MSQEIMEKLPIYTIGVLALLLALIFGTRMPYVFALLAFAFFGPNETIGQQLYHEEGQSSVISWNDYRSILSDHEKAKAELLGVERDEISGRKAFLLTYKDNHRSHKIVFIPGQTFPKEPDPDVNATGIADTVAESGEYRKKMALEMAKFLLTNPHLLFQQSKPKVRQ